MNMKGLIAATLVVIVPASLHAQEPLIPQNFLQTAPEAYYHYEPNVLECVEWLTETPLEADSFDRRTIGKFIDTWLRETPSIRISLDPTLTAFLDDAKYFEEQMTVYTGGYAAGLLELKSENGTLGKISARSVGRRPDRRGHAGHRIFDSVLRPEPRPAGTERQTRTTQKDAGKGYAPPIRRSEPLPPGRQITRHSPHPTVPDT